MITTWGIFWISFFGATVVNTLIKRVITPKYPKLDNDTYNKLRELVSLFASNVSVNIKPKAEKGKAKKTSSLD